MHPEMLSMLHTGRRFKISRDSSCPSRNVIYVAYCKHCGKQEVGSTTSWKSRLANYKSHIKNKILTCKIVKYFIDDCPILIHYIT